MRAREWAIAGRCRTPAAYDIPTLPEWDVFRPCEGGIGFETDDTQFIAAENPVTVRR